MEAEEQAGSDCKGTAGISRYTTRDLIILTFPRFKTHTRSLFLPYRIPRDAILSHQFPSDWFQSNCSRRWDSCDHVISRRKRKPRQVEGRLQIWGWERKGKYRRGVDPQTLWFLLFNCILHFPSRTTKIPRIPIKRNVICASSMRASTTHAIMRCCSFPLRHSSSSRVPALPATFPRNRI